ncbi:MAG TPA: WS/DGAT domain-containing protein [Actinomycetota bacterium]
MVVAPTRIPSLRSSPSRLDIAYPILPLAEGVGLTVGAMTWEGRLSFGLTADAAIVPDLDRLAAAVTESFEELVMAADKTRPAWGEAAAPVPAPGSRPAPGAVLPGTLASPRTGLTPAGCRELVARLRLGLPPFSWRPTCWTHEGCQNSDSPRERPICAVAAS